MSKRLIRPRKVASFLRDDELQIGNDFVEEGQLQVRPSGEALTASEAGQASVQGKVISEGGSQASSSASDAAASGGGMSMKGISALAVSAVGGGAALSSGGSKSEAHSSLPVSASPAPAAAIPPIEEPAPSGITDKPVSPAVHAPSITALLDDVGQAKGSVPSGGHTDDTMPMLHGQGTPGDTITVLFRDPTLHVAPPADGVIPPLLGMVALGTAVVDANGHWNFTPTQPLPEGANDLVAVVTDAAGNQSAPSNHWTFTVEPQAVLHKLAITQVIDDVGAVIGEVAMHGVTDDAQPVVRGTGTPGQTIWVDQLYVPTPDPTDVEPAVHSWTLGTTTVRADGTWEFQVEQPLFGLVKLMVGQSEPGSGSPYPSSYTEPFDFLVETDGGTPAKPAINSAIDPGWQLIANGGVTYDATPLITGQGQAGDMITVYADGQKIGTAMVDSHGCWSFKVKSPLVDGIHAFTATAANAAGESSEMSAPYTLVHTTPVHPVQITSVMDDVGPVTGAIAQGESTDDTTPTLHGTGTPGQRIEVFSVKGLGAIPELQPIDLDNYNNFKRSYFEFLMGTTTVRPDGTWSFTAPVPDSGETFVVVERDSAGNITSRTEWWDLQVDRTPVEAVPLTITAVLDDVGAITGAVAMNGHTDDATPTLQGKGTPGEVITVMFRDPMLHPMLHVALPVDGVIPPLLGMVALGTAVVDANGHWQFTPAQPLLEGSNDLVAVTIDAAGNYSLPSNHWTFTVQTQTVPTTILGAWDDVGAVTGDLPSGAVTDDATPTLHGTGKAGEIVNVWATYAADDPGEGVYEVVMPVGSVVVNADGAWALTVPSYFAGQGHGSVKYEFHANTAHDVEAAHYRLTIDALVQPPVFGSTVITHVVDTEGWARGNIGQGGVTDERRPVIHGTGTPGDVVFVEDLYIPSPDAEVHLALYSTVIGSAVVAADGTWQVTPEFDLSGHHKLVVRDHYAVESPAFEFDIVDHSINTQLAITHVIDTAGPVTGDIGMFGITDDSMPVIRGTGTPGTVVMVEDLGSISVYVPEDPPPGTSHFSALVGSAVVQSDGTWAFKVEQPLNPISHHVLWAYVLDEHGNVAEGMPAGVYLEFTLTGFEAPVANASVALGSQSSAVEFPVYAGSVPAASGEGGLLFEPQELRYTKAIAETSGVSKPVTSAEASATLSSVALGALPLDENMYHLNGLM